MLGVWQGQYWFDEYKNIPEILKNRKTSFNLYINEFANNNFSGNVQDDLETGGTPGIGTINGSVEGNNIDFVKKMPVKSAIFPDGQMRTLKGKHPKIYYSGIWDQTTNTLTGKWKIKFGISWLGIVPIIHPPTKGGWIARKQV